MFDMVKDVEFTGVIVELPKEPLAGFGIPETDKFTGSENPPVSPMLIVNIALLGGQMATVESVAVIEKSARLPHLDELTNSRRLGETVSTVLIRVR